MEDEEPPSKEPPLLSFGCLFILCIFIPTFIFYPFKACLGLFFLYATHVGYMESAEKKERKRAKRQLKRVKDTSSLEDSK